MKLLYSEKGVTLLEVLVSMFLTGFGLVLFVSMVIIASDGNEVSNRTTRITGALQDKLEQIRSLDMSQIETPFAASDTIDGMERTWTIHRVERHLVRVEVEIIPSGLLPRSKVERLVTYLRTARG